METAKMEVDKFCFKIAASSLKRFAPWRWFKKQGIKEQKTFLLISSVKKNFQLGHNTLQLDFEAIAAKNIVEFFFYTGY